MSDTPNKPTIDERLERLVERHEALTQSVELLTVEGRGTRALVHRVVDDIRDLVTIVRSHEQRRINLEG